MRILYRYSGLVTTTTTTVFNNCSLYGLHFDTFSNNLISLLSIGNLIINNTYVLGNYLIGWHIGSRSGDIVLYSGQGSDELIQAIHPFTNEPVSSGLLYPVIEYVFIDGVRHITNELIYQEGDVLDTDLIYCLPNIYNDHVNVSGLVCVEHIPGEYSTEIAYNNSIDPIINAEREIIFTLNNDGTTKYIAWSFQAYDVVDRITITYVKGAVETILSDWAVGYNGIIDYESTPKRYNYFGLQMVHDIEQYIYEEGDYIRINIVPRVDEPANTNTNWNLQLQCLQNFTEYLAPIGARTFDPTSVTIEHLIEDENYGCGYVIRWKNQSAYIPPVNFQYLQSGFLSTSIQYNYTTHEYSLFLKNDISSFYHDSNNSTCVDRVGTIHAVKVGSNITITFSNVTDYNDYKSKYAAFSSNANWTNYTSDTTDVNYYKGINIELLFGTSCGDTLTNKKIIFHHDSIMIWDDVNKIISIEAINISNNIISSETCDTVNDDVQAFVNDCNNLISQPDFDLITTISKHISITIVARFVVAMDESEGEILYGTVNTNLIDVYLPSDWESTSDFTFMNYLFGYKLSKMLVKITNMSDPINNFRLVNFLNEDGTVKTVGEIVYEKSGGIQIIP